jgi:hypothetical protein
MVTKKIIVAFSCCLTFLASAALASAEDFTIIVPVRLYNMLQGVGKAKVTCEVLDSKGQRIGSHSMWSTHHVNMYPAGLEEDIVLKFNANPGKDPRDATHYKCDLKLQLPWIAGQPWQAPSHDSTSSYLKPKPGTEFRVEDSGPLYETQDAPKPDRKPKRRIRQ